MDRKTERLQLRLTKQEFTALRDLAAMEKTTMANVLCQMILRKARSKKIIE